MRRPDELNSMLRHAENTEKNAKRQWLKSKELVRSAERQLQELEDYLRQYAAGSVAAERVGELINRKQFVDRLELAIAQQGEVCEQARRAERAYMERWQKQQQNLKALERLKEQRVQAVAQNLARLEQRALDELALRSLARSS